jgi:hypothetical protein
MGNGFGLEAGVIELGARPFDLRAGLFAFKTTPKAKP